MKMKIKHYIRLIYYCSEPSVCNLNTYMDYIVVSLHCFVFRYLITFKF